MYEYNIVSLWHTPDRTFLGSAIRLTADHILTAGHLLDKLEPTPDTLFVGLLPELRRRPPARIVEINKALDTMILRLDETPPGVFLKPAFQRRPIKAKAQQVKLMAADPESTLDPPREFDWGRHAILVSGSHTIASHRQGHYVITSDSYRGSSGGGVVLEGKLLGMILSRAENDPLGYALSIEQAIEWIMQVIPGFTVRDAEAEAVLCATIFAKIRRSLDISYMHPLRDTFDFDSDAQGSPERVATRLLGSFAQAIKAARPWMLDPRGGGDRNSMQQVCRQIVVWLYRLGIYDDAVLANSKRFKGNQLDQVAPCESAAALEFLRAVAVGGPEVEILPARVTSLSEVKTSRVVPLDHVASGVGGGAEEYFRKAIVTRAWLDSPGGASRGVDPERDMNDVIEKEGLLQLEYRRDNDRDYIASPIVGDAPGPPPALLSVTGPLKALALARTGRDEYLHLDCENKLIAAVAGCLREIQEFG